MTDSHRAGAARAYLDLQSRPPDVAYPPRPVPGSVADLDIIMKHCDFSQDKACGTQSVTFKADVEATVCARLSRGFEGWRWSR